MIECSHNLKLRDLNREITLYHSKQYPILDFLHFNFSYIFLINTWGNEKAIDNPINKIMTKNLSSQPTKIFFCQLLTTKMYYINIKREPKCMSFFTTFKTQTESFFFKVLNSEKFYIKRDNKVPKICVFYTKFKTKRPLIHQLTR